MLARAGLLAVVASLAMAAPAAAGVTLEVKFDEALEVRSAGVQRVLDRYRARDVSRLVDASHLSEVAARARARSRRPAPDLASWYHVTLPAGADEDAALAELRALPEVAYAYPAPEPTPPPATPDFTSLQRYFQPAPQGIDAVFSRRDPRTHGAGIRIVDLEQDWYPFHEDLGHDWSFVLGEDQFPRSNRFGDDHGTAVVGVLAARDNGFGVTGGVPEADMRGISPIRRTGPDSTSYRAADAMVYASNFMNPGDVMLLEQQTTGPNGRFAPLEWTQSVFEATQLLTQMGIVVVETGSNGNQNLDGPEFMGKFDRDVRDSGAIMVGAGSSTTHARLGFSVYGTRVDLQGWGHNVTTTGYGGLYGGTSEESKSFAYTATFSGTSSAGPVVTSAVVAIQSYLRATGQGVWSGARIADLLERTGTTQGGDTTQHIGPLPDLQAALREIEVDSPATTAALAPAPVNGWYRSPTVTLRASDDRGSGVVRTEYRLDGGPWRTYDGAFTVSGQGGHRVEYRSLDRNGNVEAVKSLGLKVDAVAPTIAVTAPTAGAVYPLDSAITAAYACDDDRSGVASCTGTVPTGTPFDTGTVGFHQFTVNATDAAGNAAAPVTVAYQVVWPFAGFFAPVDIPPALNAARAGRAIPVKFELGGDRGLDVLASGSPRSSAVDCDSGSSLAGEPAAGGLRFSDGQYVYAWRTSRAWTGTCRQLTVELADGSVHEARFKFM